MPNLLRLEGNAWVAAADGYRLLDDGESAVEPEGDAIVPLDRLLADGELLFANNHRLGVKLAPGDPLEAVLPYLPRLSAVALELPKFRDGRAFSTATLLRQRYGFAGEVRAVGDVLREQAMYFQRCGFDAVTPSDGSSAEQWAAAAGRYRHVYQHGTDTRPAIYEEREAAHG